MIPIKLILKTIIIVAMSAAVVIALAAWMQSPSSTQPNGTGAIKVIIMPVDSGSGASDSIEGHLEVVGQAIEKSTSFTLASINRSTSLTISGLTGGVYKLAITLPGLATKIIQCGKDESRARVANGSVSNCVAYFAGINVAEAAEKKCKNTRTCGSGEECRPHTDYCRCMDNKGGIGSKCGDLGGNNDLFVAGDITVKKECKGSASGSFSIQLDTGAFGKKSLSCGSSTIFKGTFNAAIGYNVMESAQVGWEEESNTCKNIRITKENPHAKCTIVNKKTEGPVAAKTIVRVTKICLPANGIGIFSIGTTAGGRPSVLEGQNNFKNVSCGKTVEFVMGPGEHFIFEKEPSDPWVLVGYNCNQGKTLEDNDGLFTQDNKGLKFTIKAGETVECTITNRRSDYIKPPPPAPKPPEPVKKYCDINYETNGRKCTNENNCIEGKEKCVEGCLCAPISQ